MHWYTLRQCLSEKFLFPVDGETFYSNFRHRDLQLLMIQGETKERKGVVPYEKDGGQAMGRVAVGVLWSGYEKIHYFK